MKKQSGYQFCGGKDHAFNPNRRDFLSVGALGGLGLGLSLGDLLSLKAQAAGEDWKDVAKPSIPGKAKNIIQIFLPGGAAHQETFDPNSPRSICAAVLRFLNAGTDTAVMDAKAFVSKIMRSRSAKLL